jgi:nitroreductase
MSELLEIIRERRSVRRFLDKDISGDILNQLFEAVRWSPSWANTQCWEIVAIKDRAVKEDLQKTIAPKNPATKAIVSAPVLIAVCGKKDSSGYYNGIVTTKFGDWMLFDLGIATQSFCLAAHNLGLGTVVVGLFDHDRAGKILAVPEGYELVALIPTGYPAKTPSPPKRRKIDEFVRYDKF